MQGLFSPGMPFLHTGTFGQSWKLGAAHTPALTLCAPVPRYLCCLKIQTKCQITAVSQQLSIFSSEDLAQRPKNNISLDARLGPAVTKGRELHCYFVGPSVW